MGSILKFIKINFAIFLCAFSLLVACVVFFVISGLTDRLIDTQNDEALIEASNFLNNQNQYFVKNFSSDKYVGVITNIDYLATESKFANITLQEFDENGNYVDSKVTVEVPNLYVQGNISGLDLSTSSFRKVDLNEFFLRFSTGNKIEIQIGYSQDSNSSYINKVKFLN